MTQTLTGEQDTIVIGAGLAGLSAALSLQKHGQRVLLIEKRNVAGGLCGTAMVDGYEFAIGCNDFGQGLVKMVQELEVPVPFKPSKATICYGKLRLRFPLDLRTVLKLLPESPDLYRFVRAFRRSRHEGQEKTLGELISEAVRSKKAADVLGFLAFAACIPPAQCGLQFVDHEKLYKYGYAKPMTPEGGPRALAEGLSNKFLERGEILFSTEVLALEESQAGIVVRTTRGNFHSPYVISTMARDRQNPAGAKGGLAVSLFLLAVRKEFPYPETHSMTHYPPGIDHWFSSLDKGEMPCDFAFNMVRSELSETREYHSVTVYFFLPRGMESIQDPEREYVTNYIFRHVELMLPGISDNIIHSRLIDPLEYRKRFFLSSKAMAIIPPRGYQKGRNYGQQTRIHYAGHAEFPPGDHAGAAFLSGRCAARDVLNKIESVPSLLGSSLLSTRRDRDL